MSGLFDYTDFPDEPAEFRSPADELTHVKEQLEKCRDGASDMRAAIESES